MTATAIDRPEVDDARPAPSSATARLRAAVEAGLILVGLLLLAVGQQYQITSDGEARFTALTRLLDTGELVNDRYSLIGPLFAAPLWAAGTLAGDVAAWVGRYNILVFALGLAAMYGLLRGRVDGALLRRFLLLVVAGSLVAVHVTNFYGEMFTAMGVGVGIVAALVRGAGPGTRVGGWIAVALGVANTPATIVGLGLVGSAEAVRHRRLRYAAPVLAGVLLVAAEAWLRRGNPFDNGYADIDGIAKTVMPYSGQSGFSYPFFLGLLAILFSFGKGIVWYMPGLLLPVWRRLGDDLRAIWLAWTLFLAGLVLVYASWWAWYGGVYWGPRFFLIGILPASLALAVWLQRAGPGVLANLVTLAVLALSMWVGANSLAFGGLWAWPCYENYFALEALCHFTPEFSALWYPFVAKPAVTGQQLLGLLYHGVVFLWLAAPVLGRLIDALADLLATRAPEWLSPSRWRW